MSWPAERFGVTSMEKDLPGKSNATKDFDADADADDEEATESDGSIVI